MTRSYLEHFGLREAPFSLTSDPRFIYGSRSYSAAIGEVTGAVERREGLIVITGGHGTGKTTLCRALIQHLPLATRLSAVPSPHVTAGDLVSQITADFGLSSPHELERFLVSLLPSGALAVVIIDEAQQLAKDALEQIRRLSSLEAGGAKLLQIILVGQPDLRVVLERDVPDVDGRISLRAVLRPLSPDEVGPYISRRLEVARAPNGGDAGTGPSGAAEFSMDAVDLVAQLSRGVPRIVNLVCDHALDIGAEGMGRWVERDSVLGAADRLQLGRDTPEAPKNARLMVMSLVAGVVAVVAIGVWLWIRPPRDSSRALSERASYTIASAPSARPSASASPAPPTPPQEPAIAVAAAEPVPSPVAPRAQPAPVVPVPEPAPAPPPVAEPVPAVAEVLPTAPLPIAGRMPIVESVLVSFGAYKTEADAGEAVKRLSALGLPVFSRPAPRRGGHNVVVGPYVSRAEALAAKAQVEQLHYLRAQVIVESSSRRERP